MFGEMNVVPIIDLRHTPEEVGGSVDGAMTRLLDVTEPSDDHKMGAVAKGPVRILARARRSRIWCLLRVRPGIKSLALGGF